MSFDTFCIDLKECDCETLLSISISINAFALSQPLASVAPLSVHAGTRMLLSLRLPDSGESAESTEIPVSELLRHFLDTFGCFVA